MPDYHAMYLKLIAAQAGAINALQKATGILMQAHQEAEEIFLSGAEPGIHLLEPGNEQE